MKRPSKQNKKILKKFKKNGWVGTLVIFLLFTVFINAFAVIMALVFVRYVGNHKLLDEYQKIYYMARLYDDKASEGDEAYRLLDMEGRPYFITDKQGNIIYQNGENTRSDEHGYVYIDDIGFSLGNLIDVNLGAYSEEEDSTVDGVGKHPQTVMLYSDAKTESLYAKNGKLRLKQVKNGGDTGGMEYVNSDGKIVTEDEALNTDTDNVASILMPGWLELELENGGYIYGKFYISINYSEVTLLGIVMIILLIIHIFIMTMLIIRVVSNVKHQRGIVKLYFSDEITKGRNWAWFKYRGAQILSKRSNAKHKYALLDVVFVNYRNYCICHSVREGELMLQKMNTAIVSTVAKNEAAAHFASANFVVLYKYDNNEELRARINELIRKLEGVDEAHYSAFHVGVDLIDVLADKKGRFKGRKYIDFEIEYNNACAARASLDEKSDESAYAFLDENLVEKQRWVDMVQERQQRALNKEEFVVYYQPKYDPRTNILCGAEALIRWNSPEFGLVPPGRFIPIFEKNGFITEIDHYMIWSVARDQKKWLDMGRRCVPVSVNISRAHFIESDLAEQIRSMVDSIGTPHELIELELTESAFFDDKKSMIAIIRKLKDYGFVVSMDDFGSGYSSLNSLKDMPLDVLKLDAEFFRGDLDNPRSGIVVTEAIKLAKDLDMRTVAEGVEAKEQVDFLAGLGCDMIQGYYFAKPMPRDEFEERVKIGRAIIDDGDHGAVNSGKPDKAAEPEKSAESTENNKTTESDKPAESSETVKSDETVKNDEPTESDKPAESDEPAENAEKSETEEERNEKSDADNNTPAPDDDSPKGGNEV